MKRIYSRFRTSERPSTATNQLGAMTMTTQTKKSPNTSEKLAPLTLATPSASTDWFEEPGLLFANGMGHIDPKVGIPLYGPRSFGTPRHKREIHIGMIGTAEAVANA